MSDINVDTAIFGDFGCRVVLLDEILANVAELEACVFISGHGGIEVKIFDINGHELGISGGDDAVEE